MFICIFFGLNILHFSNLYVDNKVYKIVFILILLNFFMVTFLVMSLNSLGVIGVPMSTLIINLLFLIYLKKNDVLNIISKYEIILAICCILLIILYI